MSEKVETTGEEKKFELGERARKKKKKKIGETIDLLVGYAMKLSVV